MGYTHYWSAKTDIPVEAWALIRADVEKLFAASPVKLVDLQDRDPGPPMVDDNEIFFDAAVNSCETFYFTRTAEPFSLCKTAQQPYDLVVTAVLAVVHEHCADVEVSSDGTPDEWKPGLDWASQVLGRKVPLPLSKKNNTETRA